MAKTNSSARKAWQRPTLVRMGAADAEARVMMSRIADSYNPHMMMGS